MLATCTLPHNCMETSCTNVQITLIRTLLSCHNGVHNRGLLRPNGVPHNRGVLCPNGVRVSHTIEGLLCPNGVPTIEGLLCPNGVPTIEGFSILMVSSQ